MTANDEFDLGSGHGASLGFGQGFGSGRLNSGDGIGDSSAAPDYLDYPDRYLPDGDGFGQGESADSEPAGWGGGPWLDKVPA